MPDRVDRAPAHAEGQAGAVLHLKVARQLGAVEGLDALGGEVQRLAQLGTGRGVGGLDLGSGVTRSAVASDGVQRSNRAV